MATVALGLVATAIAWLAILIIGQPVRNFFDLRRDIRARMLIFANVPAPKDGQTDPRFLEAQTSYRDLGARMISLADTHTAAAKGLLFVGFDPGGAGRALIGLSNALPTYGAERVRWRTEVERALKFPA